MRCRDNTLQLAMLRVYEKEAGGSTISRMEIREKRIRRRTTVNGYVHGAGFSQYKKETPCAIRLSLQIFPSDLDH